MPTTNTNQSDDGIVERALYYCTRCQSIVRETDDFGEFVAGKCNCAESPSPWVSVDEKWAGLAPKFRPGRTALPKSITLARGLLLHAKSVSPKIAIELMAYLDAAYERQAMKERSHEHG